MQEQTPKKLTPVSQLGEFGLIDHLNKGYDLQNESSIKGIGDDAAVIDNRDYLTVVSTDLLIEGIHFDLMYVPMKHLGYKAVAVNLSDIYAMNAEPQQITIAIALSSKLSVEALEELYAGIYAACRTYNVDVIGGDTSSSQKGLFIAITALGRATADKITYRNTAQVGDYICVSGDLGAAYLGLQLLEREKRIYLENPDVTPDLEDQTYLVGRQLRPEPRRDIIEILKGYGIKPTSMIDISDGLSSELLHLCKQSGVGCRIFDENIPLHEQTYEMAKKFNLDPLMCALHGGEDYELLFTVNSQDAQTLESVHGISIIGRITTAAEGCRIFNKSGSSHELIAQGWQHAK